MIRSDQGIVLVKERVIFFRDTMKSRDRTTRCKRFALIALQQGKERKEENKGREGRMGVKERKGERMKKKMKQVWQKVDPVESEKRCYVSSFYFLLLCMFGNVYHKECKLYFPEQSSLVH